MGVPWSQQPSSFLRCIAGLTLTGEQGLWETEVTAAHLIPCCCLGFCSPGKGLYSHGNPSAPAPGALRSCDGLCESRVQSYFFPFGRTSRCVELSPPGIEPEPCAVQAQSLNHCTAREPPEYSLWWQVHRPPARPRPVGLCANKPCSPPDPCFSHHQNGSTARHWRLDEMIRAKRAQKGTPEAWILFLWRICL